MDGEKQEKPQESILRKRSKKTTQAQKACVVGEEIIPAILGRNKPTHGIFGIEISRNHICVFLGQHSAATVEFYTRAPVDVVA